MEITNTVYNKHKLTDNEFVDRLNSEFYPLSILERISRLYEYFDPSEVMLTSSFGTKSVFLLHHIHRSAPEQRIYFLDTKYHYNETYAYKESLRKEFDFQMTYVYPDKKQNELTTDEQWWLDHPRMCCTVNKIAPLEPYIKTHKVWISGLMSYQTTHRSRFRIFEVQGDILKFHPIIDTTEEEVQTYIDEHQLIRHPLEEKGFGSIGCTHCTKAGTGRSGRWEGTPQKECGLHLNYFYKNLSQDK
jgi:phosphoadenosine phosphosulfate reductase